ncbi:hypothetical protein [Calothrix sp. PCC 6303]|uniref:hypothetical protein n=1 Tax=Calothrix sp. PCC 6303 TaxID=1170562 RepID=UPI0002A041BF|nr:hypothetical protein [Calothrix sp. PCC 6303]AFY99934.1 hypothetical protein Cal6303_0870 [Calothrix sp. PCC 6303]
MTIPFTDREIEKAWRENKSVYITSAKEQRKNSHRLLLFYAVECGLKAILMRREGKKRTDLCTNIYEFQHDINKLLDYLRVGGNVRLPSQLSMEKLRSNNGYDERKFSAGELNQMWRYGGCCSTGATDEELEKKLLEIVAWIDGELKRP